MDDDFGFGDLFKDISDTHKRLDAEFMRLACDPSHVVPKKGDRVLFAGGLLGYGHPWIRIQGYVLECGDTAFLVRFDHYGDINEEWVHQALVTDVLAPKKGED